MPGRKPPPRPLSKRQKVLVIVMLIASAALLGLGATVGPDKTWRPPRPQEDTGPAAP